LFAASNLDCELGAGMKTVMWSFPSCESGDFFARGRELPVVPTKGDLLAQFWMPGAYGQMVLASNYNSATSGQRRLLG